MAIHYVCRHCGTVIGSIEMPKADSVMLGLNILSGEDRAAMVSYEQNGDIQVRSICEDCQESFDKNPNLHQYDYLIH
ncbi:anti-sigma-F factor Fin family protein [Bacillus sp. B-jedd]|uniref:anti-sigma-F factor Fin family protein n=1 Tax=Bacillus sp. B-jedd TaxID=1476857 RepID=UPI0005155A37|nr:anti-sigma-F factor Fin family protein [Bacillus sp. B-jedd]CEG29553.1 YabK [Bacillus sp. B-jedd]